jgi:TIGR03085 family protein
VRTYAAVERAQLVEALRAVPADAPTLCAGWTALDLAAHLVARERRPDSLPGLLLSPMAGWTERVRAGYARRPYPEVIDLIASGPPWSSPFALPRADGLANFTEHLIHTEDVRRGRPGWKPRELDPAEQEEIWKGLRSRGRMFFRAAPVAVVLALPDGRRQAVAGDGPHVTLTGEPLELLLYAAGRTGAAQVEITGPDEAVRKFSEMSLGI